MSSTGHFLTNRFQSLPVLKKASKRLRAYSFVSPVTSRSGWADPNIPPAPQLQLDGSPPRYDEDQPAPEYDSHNQPIPPSLQLKRYSSSQRYSNRQNQLAQELSVKLISVVFPKQCSPPPRPDPRKILNEDIRVRKLRGDKYDLSYCLPKTQVTPRPPRWVIDPFTSKWIRRLIPHASPLRQELARAS